MFYYPLSPRALRSAETVCALYYERRRSSPSTLHGDVPIFGRFGLLLAIYQHNRSDW